MKTETLMIIKVVQKTTNTVCVLAQLTSWAHPRTLTLTPIYRGRKHVGFKDTVRSTEFRAVQFPAHAPWH